MEEAFSPFHVSNSVSVRIFIQVFHQQILHTLIRFPAKAVSVIGSHYAGTAAQQRGGRQCP
ncbi:hypothetical protein ACVWYU_000072 [Pseudomonas sp. TE12234]